MINDEHFENFKQQTLGMLIFRFSLILFDVCLFIIIYQNSKLSTSILYRVHTYIGGILICVLNRRVKSILVWNEIGQIIKFIIN